MPIPQPIDDEKHGDFIDRCMADESMLSEYADREQRAAVCFRQWRSVRGKALDRDARYELSCRRHEAKADASSDNGWIEGYASVFDNIDLQGDIVRRGAFAKTASERVAAGKVKLMAKHYAHGGDTLEVIGLITEAREDEIGLWIHAELDGSEVAQAVRRKVLDGMVNSMSIGYSPLQWANVDFDGRQAVELTEVKLWEVTITATPANELAVITDAKRASPAPSGPSPDRRDDETSNADADSPEPDACAALDAGRIEAAKVTCKRARVALEALMLGVESKAYGHNSKVAEDEPKWGSVKKNRLPRLAFADMGAPREKDTWSYPHHWIDGGDIGEDGLYAGGAMYLHLGGLRAAWSAAHGARTGQEASDAVKAHLARHRRVVGVEE